MKPDKIEFSAHSDGMQVSRLEYHLGLTNPGGFHIVLRKIRGAPDSWTLETVDDRGAGWRTIAGLSEEHFALMLQAIDDSRTHETLKVQ